MAYFLHTACTTHVAPPSSTARDLFQTSVAPDRTVSSWAESHDCQQSSTGHLLTRLTPGGYPPLASLGSWTSLNEKKSLPAQAWNIPSHI